MININNNELKRFIETVLNKNITDVSDSDLEKIENISITIKDGRNSDDFKYLSLFPNLRNINISRTNLTPNDILVLNQYIKGVDVRFYRCFFERQALDLIKLGNSFEMEKCYNDDYSFLSKSTSLKKLRIINPQDESTIDLSNIENNRWLEELVLESCILENFDDMTLLENIEELSLLNTGLPNNYVDVINRLPKLRKLFFDSSYNTRRIRNGIEVKNDLNEFLYEEE